MSILFATVVAAVSAGLGAPSVSAAIADPLIDQQWGLTTIGARDVWNQSTGVGVTVAVIDTGSGPHPDLDANLEPGRSIIGLVDIPSAIDVNSHGTHVTGIVAAINGNGIGVSGVAPNARILPLRVFASEGQSSPNDVARAIEIAVDAGVRVINLSLGSNTESISTRVALQYAADHDVLVVAAAGNEGENQPPSWPAADDNTLAVTALDENHNVASFARRGEYIDISAPGVTILSTRTSDFSCRGLAQPAGYGCGSGTSFATPFVSGAAALLFSARPSITAAQVRFLLISTAIDLGTAGRDATYGAGLINLPAAFAALNIMFPMVTEPAITTTSRVGSVATGVTPTMIRSPQMQWYRCTAQGSVSARPPADCAPIANAVALTYQMTAKDLRLFLRFNVTTSTGGVTTTALSATSPKIIGIWLKVDEVKRGTTYNFAQLIGSPSKGARNVKVLAGGCSVKNLTLVVRPKATECTIKVTINAKPPFPQLAFTVSIRSVP